MPVSTLLRNEFKSMGRPKVQPRSTDFGTWLTKEIERSDLQIKVLAIKAGLSQGFVSQLRIGDRNPSRAVVESLARALCTEDTTPEEGMQMLNQGLLAAGYSPVDDERDPAMDDVVEAGYAELDPETKAMVLNMIKRLRGK